MANPLISFGGIASGLDTKSIIAALVAVRSKPIQLLQAQKTDFDQLRTRYKAFQAKLETLRSAAEELKKANDFLSYSASSSNTTVLDVTATGDASATSFTATVTALAKAETELSTGFADFDTTSIGAGTLKITVAGETTDVVIKPGEETLEEVRDAINDSGAGVTATIVNEGGTAGQYKLVVTAKESGAANAVSFSDELSGAGIAAALGFTQIQQAEDAVLSVNGVTVQRSTNVVDDVVPGVTFDLKSLGTSTVAVNADHQAIEADIQKYVSAHNDLVNFVNSEIAVSTLTSKAGAFNGEATVRNIKNLLLQQSTSSYPGGSFSTLATVGLSLGADGTMAFDAAKFEAAAGEDLEGLTALFTTQGDFIKKAGFQLSKVPDQVAAGAYTVDVTQAATRAELTASLAVPPGGLAQAETLSFTAGAKNVDVTLAAGDDAAAVAKKINDALGQEEIDVTATEDGGVLTLSADDWGSAGGFSVVSDQAAGAGSTGLGTTVQNASALDVAGTIGGHAATGAGQYLTGAAGTPVAGVEIRFVGSAADSATLQVGPDGFFTKMEHLLEGLLASEGGAVDARIGALDDTIEDIDDRIESLGDRVDQYEQLLVRRFTALEEVMGKLQSQQGFLSILASQNFSK